MEYGVAFGKGRGTAATATGRIVTGPDGQIGLQDTQVKIENFEAEVQVETGARTRTTIDAEPFDLAGWETMIPPLAESDPAGEIGIRGLVVATEPLEVRGALDLHDVRLRRGDGAEVVLHGGLRGTGSEIRSEKLVARLAGQEIRLSVVVTELAGRPQLATEVEADAVESSALLALFTEKSDTLQGPLELRGKLAGPLGVDRPLAETLEGTVRMRIEPGRLKGVSVLERTFQGIGTSGDAARLAGRLEGERALQRFYDDEFQYLGGTLQIARGLARTDDLKLVYHNYTVDLRGTVGLRDQQLDLRGKLTIDDEIDGAIASEGTADQSARARTLPRDPSGPGHRDPRVAAGGDHRRGGGSPGGHLRHHRTARGVGGEDRQVPRGGGGKPGDGGPRWASRTRNPGSRASERDGEQAWFTVRWSEEGVQLLDQRELPGQEVYLTLASVEEVAQAIESLAVRGAPAIGCTAAMGVARCAVTSPARDLSELKGDLQAAMERLARTRPTAVNLFWALRRMGDVIDAELARPESSVPSVRDRLVREAQLILEEDVAACRALGAFGLPLVPDGARILTHCNAGALATARLRHRTRRGARGGRRRVAACRCSPTRRVPSCRGRGSPPGSSIATGSRSPSSPTTCPAHLMQRGEVDLVVVGADRIAANGDVANKIGTYGLAVLAREHGIPFYVAAPLSTIDLATASGDEIPIEERGREEVAEFGARPVVPKGVPVRNPAFDITPAALVDAIVTERGVAREPYRTSLASLLQS